MHWFWRAAIAAIVGGLGFGLIVIPTPDAVSYLILIAASFLSLAIYGVLTSLRRPKTSDSETRCRKCRHILRGITEPRCPECGERI